LLFYSAFLLQEISEAQVHRSKCWRVTWSEI